MSDKPRTLLGFPIVEVEGMEVGEIVLAPVRLVGFDTCPRALGPDRRHLWGAGTTETEDDDGQPMAQVDYVTRCVRCGTRQTREDG